MSIAKEGYPYILVLAALGVAGFVLGFPATGAIFLVLAGFVTFFFRDPDRRFSGSESQVAAPADGKVLSIRKEGGAEALSIFLSVFDVHVNRSPVQGTIRSIQYTKGKFLFAWDERASIENEQNAITIDRGESSVRFVQIAGILARRIVCWRKEGERLAVGERIGLIKFGSRVDVFLPAGSRITVRVGQKVKAGESVIGELG